MATNLGIDDAGPKLKELLDQLPTGSQVNLVRSDGKPVAVVVSLKDKPAKPLTRDEWLAEWDELSREITEEWKSDKSAVEIVSEMRR